MSVLTANVLDVTNGYQSEGWASLPWVMIIVVALIVAAIALLAWVQVGRGHRRRAGVMDGPSVGARLRALWQPFYQAIPRRALHYPTVIVLGEAGVGKTHAIGCHVDWRGQSNQFRHSVDHDAAMQLYFGPDVVVHELSAAVLRDVSAQVRRGLHRMWRHIGPSATVVLAIDARTLATTPPEELRRLAQLVRGKIGLFPRRCRSTLDVRLYLSHLDQIEGYEEFASVLGSDHGPVDIGREKRGKGAEFVTAFDGHLAYALTSRTGDEFDRILAFYGVLPTLIESLNPLLESLAGVDEPFAERYATSRIYLGSRLPRSHIGRPFAVDRSLIASSIGRARRRGLRGSAVMAVGLLAVVFPLMYWHSRRIAAAEEAVERFEELNADRRGTKVSAAQQVTHAVASMSESEILWFRLAFESRKKDVQTRFEREIRKAYLEPKLNDPSYINLLYVTSLIYASRDNELGRIIKSNKDLWATALEINPLVVQYYVESSEKPHEYPIPLPEKIEGDGERWTAFVLEIDRVLADGFIGDEERKRFAKTPALPSREEYEVLARVYDVMSKDKEIASRVGRLMESNFDSWVVGEHEGLGRLRRKLIETDFSIAFAEGWGLAKLVNEIQRPRTMGTEDEYTIAVGNVEIDGREVFHAVERTRNRALVNVVLTLVEDGKMTGGMKFFGEDSPFPDAGGVRGYGGGASRTISGFYTRDAFEQGVAPVLDFAGEHLSGSAARSGSVQPAVSGVRSSDAEDDVDRPAGGSAAIGNRGLDLTEKDMQRLDDAIRSAIAAYSMSYREGLLQYYSSFEIEAVTDMTLPYVLKAFVESSSWVFEFLLTVVRHATLKLPEDNEYYRPMIEALREFAPLRKLMLEEGGALPALEPYQQIVEGLRVAVVPDLQMASEHEATELEPRLSRFGAMTLRALRGTGPDHIRDVELWLYDSGLEPEFYEPFMAPVEQARRIGLENLQGEVERAWIREVRPIVEPLMDAYPFDTHAAVDADPLQLEALARRQGEEPGEFWLRFDTLIAPAMESAYDGNFKLFDGLRPPRGMLVFLGDLDRMSRTLWDENGGRVPIEVSLTPALLPAEEYDGRVATMVYLRSGGDAVYGFNQHPSRQSLGLEWWNQGSSIVALRLEDPDGRPDVTRRVLEHGAFSFFRLLDRGELFGGPFSEDGLTERVMAQATRCGAGGRREPKVRRVEWNIPMDDFGTVSRRVRIDVGGEGWWAFAVRDCRW